MIGPAEISGALYGMSRLFRSEHSKRLEMIVTPSGDWSRKNTYPIGPFPKKEADRHADAPDDLAAAFEPAIRHADDLADRRFDNAEAAGRLAEMSRSIDEQTASVAQMRERQETLLREGERLDADWQALWKEAPISALAPDLMLEWLRARTSLLEAVEDRAEATSAMEVLKEEEREAREGLLKELSSLGAERGTLRDDTLRILLERAEGLRIDYEERGKNQESIGRTLEGG